MKVTRRVTPFLLMPFFCLSAIASVNAADKGELESTMIELSHVSAHMNDESQDEGLAMRLRNETVDGWYIDLFGADSDMTFVDDQGDALGVNYWANARLGKAFKMSEQLDMYAGIDATYAHESTDDRLHRGLGGHVGVRYTPSDRVDFDADVSHVEWLDNDTVRLRAQTNVALSDHAYVLAGVQRLLDADMTVVNTGLGVRF
ncbi:MAG: hypothetical protein AAGF06_01270 [Pseudomonadota bacterium]